MLSDEQESLGRFKMKAQTQAPIQMETAGGVVLNPYIPQMGLIAESLEDGACQQ